MKGGDYKIPRGRSFVEGGISRNVMPTQWTKKDTRTSDAVGAKAASTEERKMIVSPREKFLEGSRVPLSSIFLCW